MNFYKVPVAFAFWTVLYSTGHLWIDETYSLLFNSSITVIYLSYMCFQLHLMHKMIKKEKEDDKKMLEEMETSIKRYESYVNKQISILQTIEKKRDSSIRRLN